MREKIIVFTDGGSRGNPGKAGVGIYITNATGEEIYKDFKFLGIKTNNEAEYLALHLALNYLKINLSENAQVKPEIVFKLDSKLVVEQMNKKWQIKEARLRELAVANWQILESLPCFSYEFKHIPREENKMADLLANQAMDSASWKSL